MLSNSYDRIIEWGDCDPADIVFNPNFFAFFDQGTTLLYGAAGWPKKIMLERFGGAGCPLVFTGASFKAPCTFGDTVTITTSISEVGRSSFKIEHKLFKGDLLCVEGNEGRVWTVRDPETGKLRSGPIPDELRARFLAE